MTFDIECLKVLNSTFSGPLMNAQFSREQLLSIKISIQCLVILRGIKIFRINALKLVLQYLFVDECFACYCKRDKPTKTEDNFWIAPILCLCVFLKNNFFAKLRVWKLDLKDDTRNKYTAKTFLDSLNMFSRPFSIDSSTGVSWIFYVHILLSCLMYLSFNLWDLS